MTAQDQNTPSAAGVTGEWDAVLASIQQNGELPLGLDFPEDPSHALAAEGFYAAAAKARNEHQRQVAIKAWPQVMDAGAMLERFAEQSLQFPTNAVRLEAERLRLPRGVLSIAFAELGGKHITLWDAPGVELPRADARPRLNLERHLASLRAVTPSDVRDEYEYVLARLEQRDAAQRRDETRLSMTARDLWFYIAQNWDDGNLNEADIYEFLVDRRIVPQEKQEGTKEPAPNERIAKKIIDAIGKHYEHKGEGMTRTELYDKVHSREAEVRKNLAWVLKAGQVVEEDGLLPHVEDR